MFEELQDRISCQGIQGKTVRRFSTFAGEKLQEESKGIAIFDGRSTDASLLRKMLLEEAQVPRSSTIFISKGVPNA